MYENSYHACQLLWQLRNFCRWSYLEVHTVKGGVPDDELAFLAGVLEAQLTGDLILMHWKNTMGDFCSKPSSFCAKVESFIANNSAFMDKEFADNKSSYWYHVSPRYVVGRYMMCQGLSMHHTHTHVQVHLFNQQLTGMQAGYSSLGIEELPQNAFL